MATSRDQKSRLSTVNFLCGLCRHKFESEPDRIDDAPERDHPFLYFAACPHCGAESDQSPWEKALMASYGKHTGPKTEQGKEAVTANLDGHPTPEEAQRTRFNAMKHGLRARVATYFPSKPGAYAQCKNCDVDELDCRASPACMKKTELFMRHDIAFKTKDPSLLSEINADFHANMRALIDDILITILGDGVVLRNPAYDFDKDGGFNLARYVEETTGEVKYIEEVRAHPLLKTLTEFTSRLGLSLSDMGMTPKVQEGNEVVMGHIADEKQDRETLLQYQKQQAEQLENLNNLIKRSQDRLSNDPVLIEHENG